MKFSDLMKKSVKELQDLLIEYRGELFTLRFKNATRQLDKTHRISEIKKDIARTLTALNQKEINSIEELLSNKKQETKSMETPKTETSSIESKKEEVKPEKVVKVEKPVKQIKVSEQKPKIAKEENSVATKKSSEAKPTIAKKATKISTKGDK